MRGKTGFNIKSCAAFWRTDGRLLTQKYGNWFTKLGYDFHNGIDLAAPAEHLYTLLVMALYILQERVKPHTVTG